MPSVSPDRASREKRKLEQRRELEKEQAIIAGELEEKRKLRGLRASDSFAKTTPGDSLNYTSIVGNVLKAAFDDPAERFLLGVSIPSGKFSLDAVGASSAPTPALSEGDMLIVESRRRRSLSRERRASAIKLEQDKIYKEFEDRRRRRSPSTERSPGLHSPSSPTIQESVCLPSNPPVLEKSASVSVEPVSQPSQPSADSGIHSDLSTPILLSENNTPDASTLTLAELTSIATPMLTSQRQLAKSSSSSPSLPEPTSVTNSHKMLKNLTAGRVTASSGRRQASEKTIKILTASVPPVVLSTDIIITPTEFQSSNSPKSDIVISPKQTDVPKIKATTHIGSKSFISNGIAVLQANPSASPIFSRKMKQAASSELPIFQLDNMNSLQVSSPTKDRSSSPISPGRENPTSRPHSWSSSSKLPLMSNLITYPLLYRLDGKRRFYPMITKIDSELITAKDSFILQVPKIITDSVPPMKSEVSLYVWHGPHCPKMKKVKAMELATKIKEKDWLGKAQLYEIENPATSQESLAFWRVFNITPPTTFRQSITSRDLQDNEIDSALQLFAHPTLDVPISCGKLSHAMLNSAQSYVLKVTGNLQPDHIYVWTGRVSPYAYDEVCTETKSQWPNCGTIIPEIEGCEHAAFKELFSEWSIRTMAPSHRSHSSTGLPSPITCSSPGLPTVARSASFAYQTGLRISPSMSMSTTTGSTSPKDITQRPPISPIAIDPKDMGKMHEVNLAEVYTFRPTLPSLGNRKYSVNKIFVCQDRSKHELPKEEYGIFHSGDVYAIITTVTSPESNRTEVIKWVGMDSNESASSAGLIIELEKTHVLSALTVKQGKDLPLMAGLFPNGFVVKKGVLNGTADSKKRLYQVYDVHGDATVVEEVDWKAVSLCSGFSYVRIADQYTPYIWHGRYARATERSAAQKIAQWLGNTPKVTEIEEGQEPPKFWEDMPKSVGISQWDGFSKKEHGALRLFQLHPCVQEMTRPSLPDLRDEGIFLLDMYGGLMLWIGSQAKTQTKVILEAYEFALSYARHVQQKEADRLNENIAYVVHGPNEPHIMLCALPGWRKESTTTSEMSTSLDNSRPKIEELEKVKEVIVKLKSATLSLVQLRQKQNLPLGVDLGQLEIYLSDQDFAKAFGGMDKAAFQKLPNWKKQDLKKKAGLF